MVYGHGRGCLIYYPSLFDEFEKTFFLSFVIPSSFRQNKMLFPATLSIFGRSNNPSSPKPPSYQLQSVHARMLFELPAAWLWE